MTANCRFMTGAQLDWNGVKVEALEDGYKITAEGCVVTIEKRFCHHKRQKP